MALTPETGIQMEYVGHTDGGPPDAGSFTTGNWCRTPDGMALCTEGGTPGTWIEFGAGGTAYTAPGAPLAAIAAPTTSVTDEDVEARAAIAEIVDRLVTLELVEEEVVGP